MSKELVYHISKLGFENENRFDHDIELLMKIVYVYIEFLIYDRAISFQCFCAIFDELKDQARA